MVILVVIEAVAILLLGLLVCGLLRSHAEILRALHGLGADLDPAGAAGVAGGTMGNGGHGAPPASPLSLSSRTASDVAGVTVSGEPVAIGVDGARQSTLLAFLTSGCTTCAGFWEAFGDGAGLTVPGGARLVVVTKGPEAESQSRVRDLAPADVPVVMSSEAWTDYDVLVAPYFVYVEGGSGRVLGEGAGQTWAQVVSLWSQALDDVALAGHASGGHGEAPDGQVRVGRAHRARQAELAAEARADRELSEAGIHPGHASLYPAPARADDARPPTADR
jgi:hypothetical protein